MAKRRLNKYLGVALGDQNILVAEVVNAGGRREVRRYAEFTFPEGTSSAQLAGAGKAFAAFLKHEGFGAREAIFGLPARWVVIKTKELPPADPETAATLLRVQADGEFSADLKEMVYDYAGDSHPKQPRQVLLMGVPKERVDQIHAFAEAARVGVEGITSSVAALAAASKTLAAPEGIVVYLGGKAAELAVQTGYGLQRIRHFATNAAAAPAVAAAAAGGQGASGVSPGTSELVAELRRTFAGLPQNGTPPSDRKLVLWDGTGLDEATQSAIATRLGMPVAAQNLAAMGVGGQQLTAEASRFAPAVALATVPYLPEGLPLNFDDSRLKPPVESSTRQKLTWVLGIAALLAIGIGVLMYDTSTQTTKIADVQKDIKKMTPDYNAASTLLSNESLAKSWYGGPTPYMNCFVAVSNAVLEVPNAFATNLALTPVVDPLRPDRTPSAGGAAATQGSAGLLKGQITGISQDKETPTAITQAMFNTGQFQSVRVISVEAQKETNTPANTGRGGRGGQADATPGGGRGGRGGTDGGPGGRGGRNGGAAGVEYSFVIGFTFTGPQATKPAVAAGKPAAGNNVRTNNRLASRTPETPRATSQPAAPATAAKTPETNHGTQ